MRDVCLNFEDAKERYGCSDQAAALLCIAEALNLIGSRLHDIDHQICMGIRMGSDELCSAISCIGQAIGDHSSDKK